MERKVEVSLTFRDFVIGQLVLLPLLTTVGLWLLGNHALTVGAGIAFTAGWMMMTFWLAGSRTAVAMAFTTFVVSTSGVIALMGFSFVWGARSAAPLSGVHPAQLATIVAVVVASMLVALWVAVFLIGQSQPRGWRTPVWSFRIPNIGPRPHPPTALFAEAGSPSGSMRSGSCRYN